MNEEKEGVYSLQRIPVINVPISLPLFASLHDYIHVVV